jgi:hypothetical protein
VPPPGRAREDAAADRQADWPDNLSEIIYVDHFGNAMTGLRAAMLPPNAKFCRGGSGVEAREDLQRFAVRHGLLEHAFSWGRGRHSVAFAAFADRLAGWPDVPTSTFAGQFASVTRALARLTSKTCERDNARK